MNDYDRANLQFLLSIDSNELKEWYESVTPDDIEYAAELMLQYSEELSIKTSMYNDDVSDLTEASTFLRRFSLGKK